VYETWKVANGGAEPPNGPRQFFKGTLENNYGLQDPEQKYLERAQAGAFPGYWRVQHRVLADPDGPGWLYTDEQVKTYEYGSGLQHDLRELCRTSPTGAQWAT
jgi:hypothetical protein